MHIFKHIPIHPHPLQSLKYSHSTTPSHLIELLYQQDKCKLIIPLENKKKVFFLSPSETISQFQHRLQSEYPKQALSLSCPSTHLNTNLTDYLNTSSNQDLKIITKQKTIQIKSHTLDTLHSEVSRLKDDQHENLLEVLEELKSQNLKPGHLGPLSYYIYNLREHLTNHPTSTLTPHHLQQIMLLSISFHSSSTHTQCIKLQAHQQTIQHKIHSLQQQKHSIEAQGLKRFNLYLQTATALSIAHISSFYYMIFHVDWLGWDIIEPITFTFQQLSLAILIRYYLKHKTDRSLNNLQTLFKDKVVMTPTATKKQYAFINSQIAILEKEKKALELQVYILNNRTNHFQHLI